MTSYQMPAKRGKHERQNANGNEKIKGLQKDPESSSTSSDNEDATSKGPLDKSILQDDTGKSTNDGNPQDIIGQEDFWTITDDCLIRHHRHPRMSMYVPEQATCPIPLRYLGLERITFTDIPETKEANIQDFWRQIPNDLQEENTKLGILDPTRNLSALWTGRTSFDLLRPKPPDNIVMVQ